MLHLIKKELENLLPLPCEARCPTTDVNNWFFPHELHVGCKAEGLFEQSPVLSLKKKY